MTEFKCIAMDPPWPEQGAGKIKRGADRHYPLIKKKEQILEVVQRATCLMPQPDPVPGVHTLFNATRQYAFNPDREGCHLWIWVTNNYLPCGLWLMEALGFRYLTNWAWVKAEKYTPAEELPPVCYTLQRPGLGQYSMGQHELLLFGTCGKAMKPSCGDRPRTALMAPRPTGEDGKMIHSAKPSEAIRMIERVSPGPRMEMFAREKRAGWAVWGNEV